MLSLYLMGTFYGAVFLKKSRRLDGDTVTRLLSETAWGIA